MSMRYPQLQEIPRADLYRKRAAAVFGVPYGVVTVEQRKAAKAAMFAEVYQV